VRDFVLLSTGNRIEIDGDKASLIFPGLLR
jgi:hypothetical protein